ncbi:L-iditol 2-dehydrogenase, partial [Salinimicrobium sp. CDJ15-91]|nr:L-iditol 2-dehydrogenase [Salinimicrobium oceani]
MRSAHAMQEKTPASEKAAVGKAAVLEAPQKVSVKEIELPEPGEGEVRINLEGS